MRIGIFGGTFDPPHLGHLILAAEASDQLHLDRLLWVLTPDPPHKLGQVLTPIEIREELIMAAISDSQVFELSRVDLDRPGPHYTLDTVRLIRAQFPEDELIYLIGGDSLHDLPNWYEPRQLMQAVSGLGVMRRPGDQIELGLLEKELPGISEKLFFIEAPLLEISSHQIRSRIAEGHPYRYYLLPPVYEIICKKGLYRDTNGCSE
ncbi:MAG: nicotinate-nucleotide adenylyltransferase [Anaerolineaceae bacterium]